MPNRAKYLSPRDIIEMFFERGKDRPVNTAKRFGIGLARLYEKGTAAFNNKKFPGGVVGTEADKHLTEHIAKLNAEILQQRIAADKLTDTYRGYIKK